MGWSRSQGGACHISAYKGEHTFGMTTPEAAGAGDKGQGVFYARWGTRLEKTRLYTELPGCL
jgi:hypothetical protein